MKRRDRILEVSLLLFNECGEANLSSVDIANELDISPGNLYYHFKGKGQIVDSLIALFGRDMDGVLDVPAEEGDGLLAQWPYLYPLVLCCYRYRFALRNINDLVFRYPEAGKQLVKLLEGVRDNFSTRVSVWAALGEVAIAPEQRNLIARLVKNLMFAVVYAESYQLLMREKAGVAEYAQGVILQLLSLLAPYLSEDQIREIHQVHQDYLRRLALDSVPP